MKNFCILLFLFILTCLLGQSTDVEQLLEQQLSQITPISNQGDWLNHSQNFEQITPQHPDNWLANYYVAFAYMQLASTYEDQTLPIVTTHLDKAQTAISKTKVLAPNHS